MKKLFIIVAMAVLLSALVLGGCAQPAPAPAPTPTPTPEAKVLKIGVVYGLTGPGSQHQIMERDVSQLCADWINEKGGVTVKGEKYKIELLVEDNKMSAAGAVDAATKLVYEDKVKFVGGGVIPNVCQAVSTVTEKNKVIYCSSRTDIVHPEEPYTFAGNYGFANPVPFLWELLLEKYPSVKSVGFIAEDETGARVVQKMSEGIAKARGLTTMEPYFHPFEAPEYSAEWTKILMQKPDAVDQGLKMPDSTANCLKTGRELGFTGPIIAAIPGDPNLIIKMVGRPEYATDFIYAGFDPYSPGDVPNPALVKEIAQRWEAKFKTPMDADGYEAWDWEWCMVQAIEKAQSLDPTDVKNAWENMTTIETTKGTAKMGGLKTFGINHMVCNPLMVSQFTNGKVAYTKWFDSYVP